MIRMSLCFILFTTISFQLTALGLQFETVDLETAAAPEDMAFLDVNGDGFKDIVVVCQEDRLVRVFIQSSKRVGAFLKYYDYRVQVPSEVDFKSEPIDLKVADLNGDSRADLVLSHQNHETLTLMFNDGKGQFHQQSFFFPFWDIVDFELGDVNGDGQPDLVVMNDFSFAVHFGQRGGFSSRPVYMYDLVTDITGLLTLELGDVNHDGNLDVVMLNSLLRSVIIFKGNGRGHFNRLGNEPKTGPVPYVLKLKDVDQDDYLDMVVGNYSSMVSNIHYQSSARPSYESDRAVLSKKVADIIIEDINHDSYMDLLALNFVDQELMILPGGRDRYFDQANIKRFSMPAQPVRIIAANIDGDNRKDLLILSSQDDLVRILYQKAK